MEEKKISNFKKLEGILAFLGENFEISDKSMIHSGLYKLSKIEEYKSILNDFEFSDDKHESQKINNIINSITSLRLLKVIANKYIISSGLAIYYKNNSKEYFGEKEELIKRISNDLKDYLK